MLLGCCSFEVIIANYLYYFLIEVLRQNSLLCIWNIANEELTIFSVIVCSNVFTASKCRLNEHDLSKYLRWTD